MLDRNHYGEGRVGAECTERRTLTNLLGKFPDLLPELHTSVKAPPPFKTHTCRRNAQYPHIRAYWARGPRPAPILSRSCLGIYS